MDTAKAHETPSDVTEHDGEVIVDGPDGVAFSLTPGAARKTAERLYRSAARAGMKDRPANEA